MTSAPSLLLMGDSHIRYFAKAAAYDLLYPYQTDSLEVGGATAVGMRNPNSKTDAIGRFRRWVSDKDRDSEVLLHLGEVDCGYVIWYRSERYQEPVETQMRESLDAYFEFVDELLAAGFSRIIITGATLPTITDDDQVGEVVLARSSITASMIERTQLTLEYNRALAARASARGLSFVDISEDVLDPTTGVVSNRLRNPKAEDHHMHVPLAAAYWARRLLPHLEHAPAPAAEVHWMANRDTFLKGFSAHSARMPEELLVPVPKGGVVVAGEVVVREDYTLLQDVRFRGRQYPMIRVLPSRHFRRLA
ncbi:hypothetical protein [Microbacterium gorillae]|uniref:hypothetical protein n=1 Tax=Microbacterium gorillae TaxID=1231063 RepID=UPI003D97323E